MKKYLLPIVVALLAYECQGQEAGLHFNWNGNNAPEKLYVSLYIPANEQSYSDSIILKQGSGLYRFPLTDVAKVSVSFKEGRYNSDNWKSFYVAAGETNITIYESGTDLQIQKSALDRQYRDYTGSIVKEKEAYEKVNKKYGDAYGNKALRDSLRPFLKAARQHLNEANSNYALSHPDSWFSLHVVNDQAGDFMIDGMYGPNPLQTHAGIRKVFNQLSNELKQSPLGKHTAQKLKAAGATLPGSEIIDFVMPALDGSVVDTKKMRGQIYLIDFWGSWCSWCRKGHPHMKELYSKYHAKGFEIVAVGVEFGPANTQRDKWLKAINDDQIPWKHVLNSKERVDLPQEYGVKAYPTKLLVNRNGVILLRVTDDDKRVLDARLAELFGE